MKEKYNMKKLMIAAAAAAMVGGAYAYIPSAPWDDCVKDPDQCEPAVFKLTANGKLSMDMGAYKTVQTLKVSKGLLVAKLAAADDVCTTVTKWGRFALLPTGAYAKQAPVCPVALTNGLEGTINVTFGNWRFRAEKLANDFTFADIDDAKKAFAGATAEVDVYVATNGVAIRTGKATVEITDNAPTSLGEITYSGNNAMSWTVQECTEGDGCKDCFETADIYVNVKAGKTTLGLKYQDMELLKWSIFGKKYADYAAVAGDGQTKYSYSLETEMALKAEDYAGSEIIDAASLYMTGFGTATLKQYAATAGKGICRDGVCVPETSAAFKLNGWFVGWYDTGVMPDEAIYTCDNCGAFLYGGTWSATYDAKLSEAYTGDASCEAYIGKDLDDIIE